MSSFTKRKENHFISGLQKLTLIVFGLFLEIFNGTRKNTIPWIPCCFWIALVNISFSYGIDVYVFLKLGFAKTYLNRPELFWLLYIAFSSLGFVIWAIREKHNKEKLIEALTDLFLNSSLKNARGKLPSFISDNALDEYTRKLTVATEGIPLDQFVSNKKSLEAGLRGFIDEIREERAKGIIEIIYSHTPMPDIVEYDQHERLYSYQYQVGKTRSKTIRETFKESPHLLVAGQSGGGKSTFLRQLITSLYLNQKNVTFKLIDLKEGLEFQLFQNLPRVEVVETFDEVIKKLSNLEKILDNRMATIKASKCKDIESYQKKIYRQNRSSNKKTNLKSSLDRQFIVIDEAAEIFLGNNEHVQQARKSLSRIARLGRACGMHLIVATQRPDVKALDPQVKANLDSIICFQMANLASSFTVLGNGRAADLPKNKGGRGIWKSGHNMIEVQTPFLTEEEASKLLEPYKTREKTPPSSSGLDINEPLNLDV